MSRVPERPPCLYLSSFGSKSDLMIKHERRLIRMYDGKLRDL